MAFLSLLKASRGLISLFGSRVNSKVNDNKVDLATYKTPVNNYRKESLEKKVLNSDSGLNLEDTKHDIKLNRSLFRKAYGKFNNTNGNLSGNIYDFMKEFVFNAKSLDYKNIIGTINYLRDLSLYSDNEAKQAAETAVTVLHHLNDYLIRQSGRGESATSQGLKNYLFGERGVLIQSRLNDMKKAADLMVKKEKSLKERRDYKIDKNKDGFDVLNASYTKDNRGRVFVNVNDDSSDGMYSNHGRLYWNIFDKMFDSSVDGKVNTRSAVTRYVKKYISDSHNTGKVDFIEGVDWKKGTIKNYAKFV